MLDSIYIGLTGLLGYSKDLSVIGNNVANVNTTGFKSSQLVFSDLFYRSQFGDSGGGAGNGSRLDFGSGLATGSARLLFAQGELRQSGNDQDVAIDGNGFFVLRRDGRSFYTRSGQFSFDADGWLVAEASKARVAALADGAGLRDINVTGLRTNTGKATVKASFTGVLNSGAAASAPVEIGNVVVYDSVGVAHTVTLKLTNNTAVTPGSWLVEAREGADKVLASGEIRFNADGTPAAGFNSVKLALKPDGIAATEIELNFGDPGTTSGVRSITAASSTVQLDRQDGYAVGSLTKAAFDDQGFLSLTYSNGQTIKGERLALASFSYVQGLQPLEGNLFEPRDDQPATLGGAGQGVFGKIAPGRVELSNVELSQEFGNLIISQRGYQASSQVISTANEMVQQLFDIKARR
jgi:flagellar hook protein FlgE